MKFVLIKFSRHPSSSAVSRSSAAKSARGGGSHVTPYVHFMAIVVDFVEWILHEVTVALL